MLFLIISAHLQFRGVIYDYLKFKSKTRNVIRILVILLIILKFLLNNNDNTKDNILSKINEFYMTDFIFSIALPVFVFILNLIRYNSIKKDI